MNEKYVESITLTKPLSLLPRLPSPRNGRIRRWEVELAIKYGVLLNLDSEFDARLIADVAREMGVRARCLFRLNPALNANTHPYLATALADSKFGVEFHQLEKVR